MRLLLSLNSIITLLCNIYQVYKKIDILYTIVKHSRTGHLWYQNWKIAPQTMFAWPSTGVGYLGISEGMIRTQGGTLLYDSS